MRTRRLLLLAITALAATALLTAACGDDDDDDGGGATATPTGEAVEPLDVTVTAKDFSFDKATISAKPGQVVNVTLKNGGGAEHSFTVGSTDVTEAEGGEEGAGNFTASDSTTEFHCKYHPTQMKGTITVSDDSASSGIGGYGY